MAKLTLKEALRRLEALAWSKRTGEWIEVDWQLRAKLRTAARHRNTPERKAMLAERRRDQESRVGEYPRLGVPWWMNRRTRKLHEHAREIERAGQPPRSLR